MSFLRPFDGKMIVLTSRNCPHCQTYRDTIEADSNLKEKTVFLSIDEDRVAQVLVEALNIKGVPSLVGVGVENEKINICKIGKDNKVESCVEGNIKELDDYYGDLEKKKGEGG